MSHFDDVRTFCFWKIVYVWQAKFALLKLSFCFSILRNLDHNFGSSRINSAPRKLNELILKISKTPKHLVIVNLSFANFVSEIQNGSSQSSQRPLISTRLKFTQFLYLLSLLENTTFEDDQIYHFDDVHIFGLKTVYSRRTKFVWLKLSLSILRNLDH